MTNLTALLCDYFDTALTADERIVMYTHIQEYGRVWLPYLADELPGADADAYIRYAAAIVELAAFAEVPGFAAYAATMGGEA